MEGGGMTKKEVRVAITGEQRRVVDVDLMTQAVIALGRELAARTAGRRKTVQAIAGAQANERAAR
jgi:hypothetical protein